MIHKCQAVSWKSSGIGGKYTATKRSPKTLTLVYLTDIVTDQIEIYKTTSKERTRSEEGQQRKSFKKPLKTENEEGAKVSVQQTQYLSSPKRTNVFIHMNLLKASQEVLLWE